MSKVVWIMNHYATNTFEQRAGRHYWMAKYLKTQGYTPVIFCANVPFNKQESIDTGSDRYSVDEVDGITYIFIKTIVAKGNGLKRVINMYLFFRNLLKVSKDFIDNGNKPDIILASSVHPLTLVAGEKIAKKIDVPCICEVRDFWPEVFFLYGIIDEKSFLGRFLLYKERKIYESADSLIFLKEGDYKYIIEKKWDLDQGGKVDVNKISYINNGIDYNDYIIKSSIDYKDKDLDSDKFKCVYTGAIRLVNNIDNIINTAKILKNHNDIIFLIFGDGDYYDHVKSRITEEKLDNVKLKGFVKKEYIPNILTKSSVNLLNYSDKYRWDRGNSSNKLFEYMASGKPVISNVKMGYSYIEKFKMGYELNSNTPEELSKAIIDMKNLDKKDYLELCGNAKRAAKNFDYVNIGKNTNEIIERLLGDEND